MTNFIKVANADNLVRDAETGAILNTDSTGYQNYMIRKQKLRAQRDQMQHQQDTINNLTQEVLELKDMVHALVASLNNNSTRG